MCMIINELYLCGALAGRRILFCPSAIRLARCTDSDARQCFLLQDEQHMLAQRCYDCRVAAARLAREV